jgi:hypothetical protein
MKSMHAAHRNLTGVYCIYRPMLKSENAKTPAMTGAVLAALIATIIAPYAAMFLGLYRWSHYAPLLARAYQKPLPSRRHAWTTNLPGTRAETRGQG